jgi:hypothetical protein
VNQAPAKRPYLIVLAEGGRKDNRKLYDQPLADGTLTIGRAATSTIVMPSGESAIGQHHCRLRIEGNVVWLDPHAHQEVYVDPDGAKSPDDARVTDPVQLLPSAGDGRVLELGGLSRSAPRADGQPTGFGQTRLRVMISDTPEPAHDTPQVRAAKKNRSNIDRSALFWRIGILAVIVGVGVPAYATIKEGLDRANRGIDEANVGIANLGKQLSAQEARLSAYYERLLASLERQQNRTVDMLSAELVQARASVPLSGPFAIADKSVWLAGYYAETTRRFHGRGTAWVLAAPGLDGRRSIITNKHVLEVLRADMLEGRGAPAIRRVGDNRQPETLLLNTDELMKSEAVHPDFSRFTDFVARQPARVANVNVFDVGRMILKERGEEARLGPGLETASEEELRGLQVTQTVRYVGFPFENLSDGGPAATLVQPRFVSGEITQISDAFRQPYSAWEDGQLVEMDATAMGGASGSPVLNSDGRVIGLLSGGDVLHVDKSVLSDASRRTAAIDPNQPTFRVPIGFAYVVRSDVVGEIALGRQRPDRSGQWARLLDLRGSGAAPDSEELAAWKEGFCAGAPIAKQVLFDRAKLDGQGLFQRPITPVKGSESHFFSAYTDDGRLGGMQVLIGKQTPEPRREPANLRAETPRNIRQSTDVRLAITGTPAATVTVEQYSCPPATGAAQ